MTNVWSFGIQLAPTGHSVLMKGQPLEFKLIVQVDKLCFPVALAFNGWRGFFVLFFNVVYNGVQGTS